MASPAGSSEVAEHLAPTFLCLPHETVDAVFAVLVERLDASEVPKLTRYLPQQLRSLVSGQAA